MLKLSYSREKYLMKQRGIKSYLINLVKKKTGHAKKESVIVDVGNLPAMEDRAIDLRLDDKNDLLSYKFMKSGLTRWEFLEESMRKMEQGDHVYTWAENGILCGAAWFHNNNPEKESDISSDESKPSLILYEIYLNPESKTKGIEFINSVLDIFKEKGEDCLEIQFEEEHASMKRHLIQS
jgi:hypothetical protein